ncbi:YhgE/Pip family protein [Heyndrickxia sporothermodurans]
MKKIFRIYTNDIKNVAKSWAAIIIILGLAILPSLYAWFNIKASWDPYGNTEGIEIAVANEDKGSDIRGEHVNIGDEIVESLKENKSLGWRFTDSKKAIDGVKHGDYYASITIPANFSEKIATVLTDEPEKPKLHYYVNEKINAIAPKITSKGASTILEEVSHNFVKTANGKIFEVFNEIGIDLETNLPNIEKMKDLIFKLEKELPDVSKVIDKSLTDAKQAQEIVGNAQSDLPTVKRAVENGKNLSKDLSVFFTNSNAALDKAAPTIKQDLTVLKNVAKSGAEVTDLLKNPTGNLGQAITSEEQMSSLVKGLKQDLLTLKGTALAVQQVTDMLKDANIDPETAKNSLTNLGNRLNTGIKLIDASINVLTEVNKTLNSNIITNQVNRLTAVKGKFEDMLKASNTALDMLNKGEKPTAEIINNLSQLSKDTVTILDQAISTFDSQIAPKLLQLSNGKVDVNSAKNGLTIYMDRLTTGIEVIDKLLPILNEVNNMSGDHKLDQEINQLTKVKNIFKRQKDLASEALSMINKGQKPTKDIINGINELSKKSISALNGILGRFDSVIIPAINQTINRSNSIANDANKILSNANKSLPEVEKLLNDSSKGLTLGQDKIHKIKKDLPEIEKNIKKLANKIRELESEGNIQDLIKLLRNDVKKQSDFFSEPVTLKEHKLFPIPNYGSGMSPFFTTLSLWVGALLLVSLLTVDVHSDDEQYKSYQIYFGRLLTFLTIAILQAIIVTIGDIYLLGAYVADKFWFILFGLIIGSIFMFMVYTLVSVFGNVGKALAIILLVLQLSGSGGTFPIQTTPEFFQAINPFLPFTYAVSMMREATGGVLWEIVQKDLLMLSTFTVITLLIGLFLKKPFNKTSAKFVENAKRSKLLH